MVSGGLDIHALHRDYGDVGTEAASCRAAAALFDFSFMSRIRIEGPAASELIGTLTPRRVDDLVPGRIRYALRLAADGGVLEDLTIWRLDAETFEIFSATGDGLTQLQPAAGSRVSVRDLSSETAIFAVQGPASLRALAALSPVEHLPALPYFAHSPAEISGVACRVGRLGYTGERGFEIILPRTARDMIWTKLARHARPAGFAAADILRIEAGFLLFANELCVPVAAAELGLDRFAAGPGAPCPGRARKRRVRLLCFGASCDAEPVLWRPRPDASFPPARGELLVTSACRSVVTKEVLGLGYAAVASRSTQLVDPAGQFHEIREVSLPFFDPRKRRPRGGWRKDRWPQSSEIP
jgi:glycine cleavage system T protein (aminomethyltransferase)